MTRPRLLHPQAVLRRLHADGRKIVVITNESTDRFKKSEAIEKAILKKTGRLMGFAKAHSCLHAFCLHALCTRSARALLHALCMRSACALLALCMRSARALHPLCTRPQAAGVPMLVLCATAKDSFRKPATGAWDHLAEEANGGVRPQLSESFYVSTRRPL